MIREYRQLGDGIVSKLGEANNKDMEFKVSLNTHLNNQQLDLNSLNQVVENFSSISNRNSRVSETSDNLEPPFMRAPNNSLASSSIRPLSRSSRIEPSISISVSKKFSFLKLSIIVHHC